MKEERSRNNPEETELAYRTKYRSTNFKNQDEQVWGKQGKGRYKKEDMKKNKGLTERVIQRKILKIKVLRSYM